MSTTRYWPELSVTDRAGALDERRAGHFDRHAGDDGARTVSDHARDRALRAAPAQGRTIAAARSRLTYPTVRVPILPSWSEVIHEDERRRTASALSERRRKQNSRWLYSSRAGRAPLAAVFRFCSFDFDEDRTPRLARIVHHFRVWTESGLGVGDAIRPLVVDVLRQRAPAALRAVRVQRRRCRRPDRCRN